MAQHGELRPDHQNSSFSGPAPGFSSAGVSVRERGENIYLFFISEDNPETGFQRELIWFKLEFSDQYHMMLKAKGSR